MTKPRAESRWAVRIKAGPPGAHPSPGPLSRLTANGQRRSGGVRQLSDGSHSDNQAAMLAGNEAAAQQTDKRMQIDLNLSKHSAAS